MNFGREDYDKNFIDSNGLIPENEPIFLLRSTDKFSPRLLLMWAMQVRLAGGDPKMAEQVEAQAQKMIHWQHEHGCKTPDMYKESPQKQFILLKIKQLVESIKLGESVSLSELQSLMLRYYGEDNVMILLPSERKYPGVAATELTFDDFIMSNDDAVRAYDMKLILYAESPNKFRILKNGIE